MIFTFSGELELVIKKVCEVRKNNVDVAAACGCYKRQALLVDNACEKHALLLDNARRKGIFHLNALQSRT